MKNTTLITWILIMLIGISIGLAMDHGNQTGLLQKIHKQNEQIIERIK